MFVDKGETPKKKYPKEKRLMSWLYSIVFAGLMFSSNNEVPVESCDIRSGDAPKTESVQTDETEKFEQSYPINANGRVSVSNVNGSVIVEAWDKNEVRLEATKIADSRESLSDVEIKVDSRLDSFSVETDYKSWKSSDRRNENRYRKLEVEFRLWVPRTAVLNEIETVNGSVTVSNFVNVTKISAVNGNVQAVNLRGAANLSTVNGEVTADFDRLETGSKINLSTVNGRVNLTIPSDANATIKADSLNGSITNDFGLPVRKGEYVGRDLYGKIGSGEVQIRLNSVNGKLAIGRKNDGKSTNPATNLLPQKTKDDDNENWDRDRAEGGFNSAKINKEVAKAVKNADKTAAIGLKVAQKELTRLAPEIERITLEGLENLKNINTSDIERKVYEGLQRQYETMDRLSNANWSGSAPFIEKKTKTFNVKGVTKVSIEARDCDVKVRGWDKPEVKYVLTEIAGRRNRTPVMVTEDSNYSFVNLKVTGNGRDDRNSYSNGDSNRVRIEVYVPKRTNLKIVTNGEIRLDGISGDIELNGVDETINVRDVNGSLRLSSVDAQVRIIGFTGELDSKTVDGDVYLEGQFSKITGSTVDGSYILTVPENYNAEVSANVDDLTIENVPQPEVVKEGLWRFGSGGPKYLFKVVDGKIRFRSSSVILANN